jgi:hypothetical protein
MLALLWPWRRWRWTLALVTGPKALDAGTVAVALVCSGLWMAREAARSLRRRSYSDRGAAQEAKRGGSTAPTTFSDGGH